jgi:hypothetical protein
MKRIIMTLLVLIVACLFLAPPSQADPSRFPNGVTNAEKASPTGMLGMLDPAKYHVYFDDFNYYDSSEWTVTTTENGGGTASEAIQAEDGGVLKLTNDNGTADNDYMQWASENWLLESGSEAWFRARWKASAASNSTLHIGLMITDTSPADVTEGIYFKVDGDGNLDFYVEEENSAESATAIATVSDDTYLSTSWYYNGVDEVMYFVDGVKKGTISVEDSDMPLDSGDDQLTLSFGVLNDRTVTDSMSIDYLMMVEER